METYEELYKQRSKRKRQLNLLRYDRSKWKEFVELNVKVKERTKVLKEMCKLKPDVI